MTTLVSVLLSLITLGSSVAFQGLVSLTTAGLYSSYLLSCGLLLWRRLSGAIKPYSASATRIGPDSLQWGPWQIARPLGILNNGFGLVYLSLLFFWSFWPPATPVDPSGMNWSVLVFGAVIVFSVVWYFAVARRKFKGPVVEIDLD